MDNQFIPTQGHHSLKGAASLPPIGRVSEHLNGETISSQHASNSSLQENKTLKDLKSINRERRPAYLIHKKILHKLACDGELDTILDVLSEINHSDIPQVLNVQDDDGDTIAHCITKCGPERKLAVIEQIMAMLSAEVRLNLLSTANHMQLTAIHLAVENNDPELAACFVRFVAEIERLRLLKFQTLRGQTVIHMAVEQNKQHTLQILLRLLPTSAAKIQLVGVESKHVPSAFHLALEKKEFIECMKALLPYTTCSTAVALHAAISFNNIQAVQLLLESTSEERKLEILKDVNKHRNTALQIAVHEACKGSVCSILNSVPRKNRLSFMKLKNWDGNTALHLAVLYSTNEILKQLLDALDMEDRVKLMLMKSGKRTAFHQAIMKRNCEALATLVEMAKDSPQIVNLLVATNADGQTVLCGILHAYKKFADDLFNTLSPISRLDVISKLPPTETRSILDLVRFNSKDAKELLTKTCGKDEDTFLHLTAKYNHIKSTERYLHKLSETDKNAALSCPNKNKKKPHQLASSPQLKDFLKWVKKQRDVYYMPTAPKILIMYSTEDRPEADQEMDSLRQVLSNFGFQLVVKPDLTADKMLNEIRNVASSDDDISGLIVVVMSHGEKGAICAKDKNVRIQDILVTMSDPALEGRPKVLLVQSCQVQNRSSYSTPVDHGLKSGASQRHDPCPSQDNQPTGVTSEDGELIGEIMSYVVKNSRHGAVEELPVPVFEDLLTKYNISLSHRAVYWRVINELLASIQKFPVARRPSANEEIASITSSDTEKTHFDLQQRDTLSIMATVNGGTAVRDELIPTFAQYLQEAGVQADLYDIFHKTHKELERKIPDQIPEMRSTLTNKLCLRNYTYSQDLTPFRPAIKISFTPRRIHPTVADGM